MKRLLLFGNKPLDKKLSQEQIDHINSFDVIVRVNKMDNLNRTGGRVDWWYFHYWCKDAQLNHIHDYQYNNISKIIISYASSYIFKQHTGNTLIDKIKQFYPKLQNQVDIEILDVNEYTHINWTPLKAKRTIPTSTIITLAHIIENYSNEYEIYLTQCDIENRRKLFIETMPWKVSWHKYAGHLESVYLMYLINNKKIKLLNL